MKRCTIMFLSLPLLLIAAGCSQQTATGDAPIVRLEVPATYDPAITDEYRELTNNGYTLLDEGKTEEAKAAFTRQTELVPEGRWGAYNLACLHGRTGDVENGIIWATKAVDVGFDNPAQLRSDPDLESLRADSRFDAIVNKAEANMHAKGHMFANGLPTYTGLPEGVADEATLEEWLDNRKQLLGKNRSVWMDWQFVAAQMDLEARRLAALKELKQDDPEFDFGLERVRAITRIRSVYDAWGPLAQGAIREAESYLATKPSAEGAAEAIYRAGIASYCEHHPKDNFHPKWPATERAMRERFAQVPSGTKYHGAAQAWLIEADLIAAGEDTGPVLPKIRQFAEMHRDDEQAMAIAGAFFQEKVVESLWPIPIDATDIDNKPVSLDQYKGKVVLVDFWATWCGPCRGELPHILAAYDKFKAQGFDILSISLDYADKTTMDDYRAWIAEKGMTKWRHIYDLQDWKGPLVSAYLVRGIPNPILIGRDGALVAMGDDCRGEKLAETIEKALSKRGV